MIRAALRALGVVARGLAFAAALASSAGAQDDATAGPPDVPAGDAALAGRVVRAAAAAPVAGAEVVLYALPADAPPGLRRGTAGPDGRFAFEGIDASPGTTYLVGARYEGVSYPGARVQFAAGERRREVEAHEVSAQRRGARAAPAAHWLGGRLVATEFSVRTRRARSSSRRRSRAPPVAQPPRRRAAWAARPAPAERIDVAEGRCAGSDRSSGRQRLDHHSAGARGPVNLAAACQRVATLLL
jgi:hypothetical protein